jgi:hypothetical protein
VIDTVGIKVGPFAMVDMYGTPHTEALHVVERYRLLDYESANESENQGESENFRLQVSDTGLARNPGYKGPGLLLEFTVEDPGVFTTRWSAPDYLSTPAGQLAGIRLRSNQISKASLSGNGAGVDQAVCRVSEKRNMVFWHGAFDRIASPFHV